MNEILKDICTLVRESGGGVDLETLAPQDIAGVAVLLKDGRVVFLNPEAAR